MVQVHHAPPKTEFFDLLVHKKLPTPWRMIGDARLTIHDQELNGVWVVVLAETLA